MKNKNVAFIGVQSTLPIVWRQLIFILLLVFISCEKPDYSVKKESYIVGRWVCTLNDSINYPNYSFTKDGKVFWYGIYGNVPGSYKLEENNLTIMFYGRGSRCSLQKQNDKVIILYNCMNNKWSTYAKQ